MTDSTASRRLAVTLAALAVAGLALLGVAPPAGAHGGDGEIEVTALTRDDDAVDVTVRLTFIADGHGVPDATVTVVVDDDVPAPMSPGEDEGDYTATVTAAPGATIRVTSVEPAATVDAVAPDAAAESTTTTPDETTGSTDATDATEPTGPTESTTTVATDGTGADEPADEDDEGRSTALTVGLVALVAVAGAGAAILVFRKPKPDA